MDSKRGNYEFTQSNPLERYLMSALGGAVGGAIFPAITKMEISETEFPIFKRTFQKI